MLTGIYLSMNMSYFQNTQWVIIKAEGESTWQEPKDKLYKSIEITTIFKSAHYLENTY